MQEPREAIPVGRFSTPEQAKGDSERRQAVSFRRVCDRHNLAPSVRWQIFDNGLSAFHGRHLSKGKLGRFLAEAEAGKVKPDSSGRMPVLVWEAVDRLTRLPQLEATNLIRRFVNLNIPILFDEADLWIDKETISDKWILLQVLIDQAYKYSERLSRRRGSSWEACRKAEGPTKHSCPRWLKWNDRRKAYDVIEAVAETVRQMFTDCAEGKSLRQIMATLPKGWSLSQVAGLLGSWPGRAVLGEWQPCDGYKKPKGEAKPNEYPAIMSEEAFHRAQTSLASRRRAGGPRGEGFVNLLKGLMYDLAGEPLWIQGDGPKWCRRVVRTRKSYLERKGAKPIPYVWLEQCVLHFVRELKASDLLPTVNAPSEDPVAAIEAKLNANKAKSEKVAKRLLEEDDTDALLDTQKALREQRRELLAALDKAKAEAKEDPAGNLTEAQSCLEALLSAEDQSAARQRAAALIRQVISRVVVIPSEERADFTAELIIFLSGGEKAYHMQIPDLREDPGLETVWFAEWQAPAK